MSKNNNIEGVGILFYFLLFIASAIGYIGNIVKLTRTDFTSPYKAEVLRTAGVIIPPVGVVMGYCNINDENNQQTTKD